jgi:hypothetical protein
MMQPNRNIEYLLNQNGAKRFSDPGCAKLSRKRLDTSKLIARNFPSYDKLRLHLFNHQKKLLSLNDQQQIKEVATYFCHLGWITNGPNNTFKVVNNLDENIIRYLRGQWLEEYVFEAFVEAGVDEVYHGQKIEWGSNESPSYFELDVIARRGNQLKFVSCKAIKTEPEQGRSTLLRQFMSEALTWNELLANGKAKVMVVTTADMVDEEQSMKLRYAPLHEQAFALDLLLIGVEELSWKSMLSLI